MQDTGIMLLAVILAIASLKIDNSRQRSSSQPLPERGFWVTETSPEREVTIVRYYATSIDLVSEKTEKGKLNITKRSTRRYLNKKLSEELAKDSLSQSIPKLYEIN
jgi:hypothetical protein